MPKMGGQEAVQKILEQYPTAKIIVLSADVQLAVRNEVLSAGAVAFINKPINAAKLKEIELLIEG